MRQSFLIILGVAVALTLVCASAAIALAIYGHPTVSVQADLAKTFQTEFAAGCGAVFGLLGGFGLASRR
jgi:hypothetical protein